MKTTCCVSGLSAVGLLLGAGLLAMPCRADQAELLHRLRRIESLADHAATRAEHNHDLFAAVAEPLQLLSRAQRERVVELWGDFFLAFDLLDQLHRDARDDTAGAALGWSALAAKQLHGARLLRLTGDSSKLAILLDESFAGARLERGTYSSFRNRMRESLEIQDLLHFVKYELPRYREAATRRGEIDGDDLRWLGQFWSRGHRALLSAAAPGDSLRRFADSQTAIKSLRALDALEAAAVTPVAVFLGSTKVKRGHGQLITGEQIHAMLPRLEPGDVVLEKTTWYLSNYFIHGFWGHAALHLGTFAEAEAYFDTPEVRAHFARLGHDSFGAYVAARFPAAVQAWRTPSATGAPRRVLEGDGVEAPRVFFNSAERAYGSDNIAVLRPRRLSRTEKAQAIVDALAYFGTPYDFAFDLRSDDAVVCTELVAKAYAVGPAKAGLVLDVNQAAAGRYVIYPNTIAETFARERGRDDAQLSFVYFLHGDEQRGRAVVASEAEFGRSHAWRTTL